jgi:hypothetical protein
MKDRNFDVRKQIFDEQAILLFVGELSYAFRDRKVDL